MQGDAPYRMTPNDILQWKVRNSAGDMVAFSTFATVGWSSGAAKHFERYGGLSAYEIVGSAAEGVSSGDAMAAMEELIATLPQGIGFEWSGRSYQERLSGKRRRCCTRSRCCSCSCALRRSTRAGRFRSR